MSVESRREPTLIGTANIDGGGSKVLECENARRRSETRLATKRSGLEKKPGEHIARKRSKI